MDLKRLSIADELRKIAASMDLENIETEIGQKHPDTDDSDSYKPEAAEKSIAEQHDVMQEWFTGEGSRDFKPREAHLNKLASVYDELIRENDQLNKLAKKAPAPEPTFMRKSAKNLFTRKK